MLEAANREIRQLSEAEEERRRTAAHLPALLAAIDQLLGELEELNLRHVKRPPAVDRQRAIVLVASASDRPEAEAPDTVQGLIDALFDAQEHVLRRRRPLLARRDLALSRGRQ